MSDGILHTFNPFARKSIGPPVIESRNDLAFQKFVERFGFNLVLLTLMRDIAMIPKKFSWILMLSALQRQTTGALRRGEPETMQPSP